MGISPNCPIQQDLFDVTAEQIEKMKRLDEVIDRINKCYGSETIVIGAQQFTRPNGKGRAEVFAHSTSGRLLPTGRKNAIKHEPKEQREQNRACSDSAESRLWSSKAQFKSKNPTTRWSDIIRLK